MYIWTLLHGLSILVEFRELLCRYYSGSKPIEFSRELDETADAYRARVEINFNLLDVKRLLRGAGVGTTLLCLPNPIRGGYAHEVSVFDNLFAIHQFELSPNVVLDYVDRARGHYRKQLVPSLLYTLNPVNWLLSFLSSVVSIPFRILGIVGLDSDSAENSWLGKIVKLSGMILGLLITLGTVLEKFDLLEPLKAFLQTWFA